MASNDMKDVFFLELNEVNFEAVEHYAADGKLPEFRKLLQQGVTETTSEQKYEHLEPWIQWVTAHTGMTFEQHGVFRLGDIVKKDYPQIWEMLEDEGVSVAAVSPMNANNRTRNAAFFIPDPWTRTKISGGLLAQKLYAAISQAVNDNADSKLAVSSLSWLLLGVLRFARFENYFQYAKLAFGARKRAWYKAMFLDLLLADLTLTLLKKHKPQFCTLFLNAGAHIQHHYMFSSAPYSGDQRNPSWYVPPGEDPVLDIYALYDRVLAQISRVSPGHRLMVATGLHQDPHDETTYYWRLKAHDEFLKLHEIPFAAVEPRMSRDFLVACESEQQAAQTQESLEAMTDAAGQVLFSVDNRGRDLFVMLSYSQDIDDDFEIHVNGERRGTLREHVAFVAIKNGQHNGVGYFVDCGRQIVPQPNESRKLSELPTYVSDVVLGR